MAKTAKWFVYILKCANGSFYTGITNNIERRLREHKTGKGAKYTRAFGVKKLVYSERSRNRSAASKREAEIKGWTRNQKLKLIRDNK